MSPLPVPGCTVKYLQQLLNTSHSVSFSSAPAEQTVWSLVISRVFIVTAACSTVGDIQSTVQAFTNWAAQPLGSRKRHHQISFREVMAWGQPTLWQQAQEWSWAFSSLLAPRGSGAAQANERELGAEMLGHSPPLGIGGCASSQPAGVVSAKQQISFTTIE